MSPRSSPRKFDSSAVETERAKENNLRKSIQTATTFRFSREPETPFSMMSEVTLGLKIDLRITAQDIREPVFAYYHELERSRENREARQHGQALVTKKFRDSGRYWVTLSFPDLPDIFCLDESHNKIRGITLEEVIRRYRVEGESFAQVSWRHENFINATWQGIQVFEFPQSYNRLKEILGEKFPKNPNWQPYRPTPQTLKRIVETAES